MIIRRRFKFVEDSDYGEIGFLPTWIKGANSFRRVAHDMIEHFLVPQCNAAEAELLALGAMLVIRIDGSRLFNISAEENLAGLIEAAMNDWVTGDLGNPRLLTTRRLCEYGWAEDVIQAAVPQAFMRHHRERQDSSYAVPHALQPVAVSWICAGVRRVYRRYAEVDMYHLGQCLMPRLDEFSQKLAEADRLVEGSDVVIHADLRTERFWATVDGRKVDV